MCLPETLEAISNPAMSRRNLFKLGMCGAAAAATAVIPGAAQAAPVQTLRYSKVLDLTHVFGPDMPLFSDADPGVKVQQFVSHKENGYYGNLISYWEHTGTHMDAPVHFDPNGIFVDQIQNQNLIVPAVLINNTQRENYDTDTILIPSHYTSYENNYSRIQTNASIKIASNLCASICPQAPNRNADSGGTMHFPGFSKEAIDFLLSERNASGIGVDTLSLDPGNSATFPVHFAWLGAGKWGLENVANLEAMPPKGATLFVGAPKVASGSGGPSRLLAVW